MNKAKVCRAVLAVYLTINAFLSTYNTLQAKQITSLTTADMLLAKYLKEDWLILVKVLAIFVLSALLVVLCVCPFPIHISSNYTVGCKKVNIL